MSEQRPEPTEEEIRAVLEEQLRNVRVEDVVLQTVATLINVAVMRLGLTGEQEGKDVGQAKMAIDAARALVPVVPPEQVAPVQDALSQVQMAFAREAQGAPAESGAQGEPAAPAGPGTPAEPGAQGEPAAPAEPGAGGEPGVSAEPAEPASKRDEEAERQRARSKIWTPPGS